MTDNIKMERIWQDIEFFELLVTCTNRNITVSTEVYMTDTSIDELHEQIGTILLFKQQLRNKIRRVLGSTVSQTVVMILTDMGLVLIVKNG